MWILYVNKMTVCRGHATGKIHCVLLFFLMIMGESAVSLFRLIVMQGSHSCVSQYNQCYVMQLHVILIFDFIYGGQLSL